MTMLLLDSSVFIRWIRQGQSPAALTKPHVRRDELMTCGIVRAEVLRGITRPNQYAELSTLFSVMNEIPTTRQVWERAVSLAWTLDRQGKVLPLPDLVIAACAPETGGAVVTHDTHFHDIPGLTVHPELPSP